MTDILTSISGQFNRSLILGTLLPVTIFVILFQLLVVPLFPMDVPLLRPLEALGAPWQVIALLFITIVLTGLLYNLNRPIIRLYEGYPWKDSWIGQWRSRYYKKKYDAIHARYKGMRTLLRTLGSDHEDYETIYQAWNHIGHRVNSDFPKERSLVLPTQLGNVIRSYEHYPDYQYGIDAIAIWPRLIAKIDKDYANSIDDAKASFDFMLNSSLLSALLALSLTVVVLFYPRTSFLSWDAWQILGLWVIEIISFLLLAHLFYRGLIVQAGVRGALVKGAFDLYRWDLFRQLGYKQEPVTREEERTLWDHVSLQILFGDSPGGPRVNYASVASDTAATNARGNRDEKDLEVTRGVHRDSTDKATTVFLRVRNMSSEEISHVIVTDTVLDQFDYEWDSAYMSGQNVPVTGINPYHFAIGDIPPKEEKVVTYRIVLRANHES